MRLANLYFLAAILLNYTLPRLFGRPGLAGVITMQLLVFGALPLVLILGGGPGTATQVFRLRPVRPGVIGKSVLMAALGWVVVEGFSLLPLYLVLRLGGHPPNPYQSLLAEPQPPWLLFVGMALVPALVEEFAFRGLILSGYAELGAIPAWVGAGLLFALAHMSLIRLPALAVLGLVLSYTALRTGSILPGVIIHGLHNGVTLAIYLLQRPAVPVEVRITDLPLAQVLSWLAGALAALPLLIVVARSLPRYPDPLLPPADRQDSPDPATSRLAAAPAPGPFPPPGRLPSPPAGGEDSAAAVAPNAEEARPAGEGTAAPSPDPEAEKAPATPSPEQETDNKPAAPPPAGEAVRWVARWWPMAASLLIYLSFAAGELQATFR